MSVDVAELLTAVGFRMSAETVRALLAELTKGRASPAQVVERVVVAERAERDRRNLAARTKAATLAPFATLDRFDWKWPRTIDRALIERLAALDFIDEGENVLFRGQPGTGKTMLAANLGVLALAKGYTVRFSTLAAALGDLLRQESIPALERRLKRYTMPDLLILDELGYLPQDARAADMLYNVIARRHETASTIISTNLAYKQWATVFPSAACIGALVDRFAQHCHVVDIDADTWRGKESAEPSSKPRPKPKPRRR